MHLVNVSLNNKTTDKTTDSIANILHGNESKLDKDVNNVPSAIISRSEFALQSARVRSMGTIWSVSDATTTTLDVAD